MIQSQICWSLTGYYSGSIGRQCGYYGIKKMLSHIIADVIYSVSFLSFPQRLIIRLPFFF